MSKRNVNHLLRVHKSDVPNIKNLQIIIRQGTNNGDEKAKGSSTTLQNHDYPNAKMKRKIFNDATQIFKDISV